VSFDQSKYVWKNGEMVPWQQATFHVSCHGVHYGTGVFEGIRCYCTDSGPAIFRLYEHIDRWLASAKVYGMHLPYTREQLADAVMQVVAANNFSSCYIRPLAIYGSDTLGLHPRNTPVEVVIFAWKWGQYLGADAAAKGAHVTISPWRKFSSTAMPATAKACGQYLNSVLAVRDAVARGFDEAILVGEDGYLAEGSGENLFLVKDGVLFTNDEKSSVLMGITRDSVLKMAIDTGMQVCIRKLSLEDLLAADEVFMTGTAVEVTFVAAVDGRPIADGRRGPITSVLQRLFADVVSGREPRYRHWLTPVATPVPELNGERVSQCR